MKKNNVLIELTPLLDVILIILFFILVQSEGRMGTFYEQTREAFAEELAVFEAELEAFKQEHAQEMDTLRRISADYDALRLGLEEDTGIIIISIVADPYDRDLRSIVVEADSNTTIIDLCWDEPSRDRALLLLNATMSDKIQLAGNNLMVVVFRFDSANIFRADHRLVSNAIHIQRQFYQLVVADLDVRM